MLSAVYAPLGAALVYLTPSVTAATITYDFNITWVTANPDGAFERQVIGINDQWPIPTIEATVGDRVIVNVQNQLGAQSSGLKTNALNELGNQSTSLHFHGLFQNGTTEMDGPVGVTQCAVAPGGSFTYNFKVRHDLVVSSSEGAEP